MKPNSSLARRGAARARSKRPELAVNNAPNLPGIGVHNRALWAQDDGQISPLIAVLSLGIIIFIGFLWESSITINAQDRALGVAESAARAGAQQISLAKLRGGNRVLTLDPTAARAPPHTNSSAAPTHREP
ncbi:pilus assembly protein TadG-related protein [Fodinicola feengrottensis]|uniref:pilus assembly protein TadG-related protein n=1 Tax=Fodinicola feengrottensis TaxID=435914 RepID=UPI0013D195BC|nr:pilus assembly protein TadG-related protein [Fodinicola feengrottensis]